jgi:predicted kinase
VGGTPGSGKTTVGALVARAAGAALVDLDSVTTPLVEAVAAAAGEVADLDAPRYAALRDARYACLAAVVADCIAAGVDVVAVAPFTREAVDGTWRDWGLASGALSVVTCWLDLDADEAARRAAARGLPRDRAKGTAPGAGAVVERATVDLHLATGQDGADVVATRVLDGWSAATR